MANLALVELALNSWRKVLLVAAAVVTPTALYLVHPRLGAIGLIALALTLVAAFAFRLL